MNFGLFQNRADAIKRENILFIGARADSYRHSNKNNISNIIYGESSDSPCDYSFENIWNLYERKGNKKTSSEKWKRLSESKKKLAAAYIPSYVAATPDKQYRKNFETFLNQETWNDELPVVTTIVKTNSNENTGTRYKQL